VCQYFLRGSCKFGTQCRNEHPQGGQGDRRPPLSFNFQVGVELTPILSLETMTKDFDVRSDKPSWSLSSYGPAKNEKNILPPLDESPEELRFKAVAAMRNGNINEYLQYEQNALANAEQVFTNVRNDIKGAFEAAKRQSLGTDAPSKASAFTGTGAGPASAYRQPPVFGAQNLGATGGFSAFAGPGPSAFANAANSPNAPTGSVFGQSAFSGTSGGAQPPQSALGAANPAPTNSAFGRPSAFGATPGSAFGQPPPFGAAGSPTSAFGQPTSTSAFGQTSTTPSNPLTPFGQPAATPSTFGQPTSAFGQPPTTSAFGQPAAPPSAFGQQTAYTSPFGVAAQQPAFGQAASPS
ncbi:hypothetical protein H4582DRAFT_1772106, partial [Lactarius indigo]